MSIQFLFKYLIKNHAVLPTQNLKYGRNSKLISLVMPLILDSTSSAKASDEVKKHFLNQVAR